MPRRTFDTILSSVGVLLTVVLVVAGGLAFWGYSFANGEVRSQLTEQHITFPPAGSDAIKDPRIAPYLTQYAGQPLTTGAQAKAYADHFIKVHIADQGKGTDYEGKTFAELGPVGSAIKAQIAALPANDPSVPALQTKLADVTTTRETVFKGETLRGLLLTAFAWWKMGQLALIGSIAAFAMALVMGILTVLGFRHRARVSPEEVVLAPVIPARRTA